MEKFVDIHTHLLYSIDDGAVSEEQSINMLRIAYEQGVKSFIATPHMSFRMKAYDKALIKERAGLLLALAREKIATDINIEIGQEVLFSKSSYENIKSGKVQTLCDTRYLLLEFNIYDSFSHIYDGTKKVIDCGYIPVIAHIERYISTYGKGRVEKLIELGVLLQLNLSSIVTWDFRKSFCRKLLKRKQVSFLGSDMHHDNRRRPEYLKAFKWLENNLEAEYLDKICWQNAIHILGVGNE